MSLRIAIFASGTGSNALNLLKVAKALPEISIPLLVVDQESSPLPNRVREFHPETRVELIVAPTETDPQKRRQLHEQAILNSLRAYKIEWIFLAGYMRIIGQTLLREYSSGGSSRIVNIHPSLLPAYPGLHSYDRAFQANEKFGGVTIHLVDGGVDTGPILLQQSFERLPTDTLESFKSRGLALEWQLYARILKQLHDVKDLQALGQGKP